MNIPNKTKIALHTGYLDCLIMWVSVGYEANFSFYELSFSWIPYDCVKTSFSLINSEMVCNVSTDLGF